MPKSLKLLLANTIIAILDQLDIAYDAIQDFSIGQNIFDNLSYENKIYILCGTGKALLSRTSFRPPEPFFEATVDAIFYAVEYNLYESDEAKHNLQQVYTDVFSQTTKDEDVMLDRLENYILRNSRCNRDLLYSAALYGVCCGGNIPNILPKTTLDRAENLYEEMMTICENIQYEMVVDNNSWASLKNTEHE